MKIRSFGIYAAALLALSLSACAGRQPLYQWGGYDAMLYQSYKNPEKVLELRLGLEQHIAKLEQSQQRVAPGLYAELGTLYLQSGDPIRATGMFTKERNTWPESRALMDAMIKGIESRGTSKIEGKS